MKLNSYASIFCLSLLAGSVLVLAAFGYSHWQTQRAQREEPPGMAVVPPVTSHRLTSDIVVAGQLQPEAVAQLKANGVATIIDLRPDGEVVGQPTAAQIEAVARAHQMAFAHVPVPHGEIPEPAVDALAKALQDSPRPILLYCRSGSRAARTWSLVEASRPGGLDGASILAAVQASGQSAQDLSSQINQRIARRSSSQ